MTNIIEQRTIALAGVLQACQQVQSLARTGQTNDFDMAANMQSILVLDAVNTAAVYGGLDGVRSGLTSLSSGILSSPKMEDVELLRYVMSILHIQAQLYRDEQAFQQFAQAVERLSSQSSDEFTNACSQLYQNHISQMKPQIIVQGEQGYLEREDVPPQIRALLLSALRSAVLWQQKGGSRFKIIWQRTRMQNAARTLLTSSPAH